MRGIFNYFIVKHLIQIFMDKTIYAIYDVCITALISERVAQI